MKSAPSRKKMADVPASVNSSQVAERTIFWVTTVAMAHMPVRLAISQKTIGCAPINLNSALGLGGPLIARQTCHTPHPRHALARRLFGQRDNREHEPHDSDQG